MTLKKSIPMISVFMLIILIVATPVCDGSIEGGAKCGNVSVITFDDSVSMNIDASAVITFHITNYNTSTSTVKIDMSSDNDIKLSSGSVTVPVGGNTTVDQTLTISTHISSADGDHTVTFLVQVMNSGETYSDSIPINVHITSKYSSEREVNKFFGIFENNLPAPFNEPMFTVIMTLIGWVIISLAISILSVRILNQIFVVLCERKDMIDGKTTSCLFIGILLYGINNSMMVFGFKEDVMSNVSRPIEILYVVIGAIVIWQLYRAFVYYFLHAVDDNDDSVDRFDVTLIPLFNFIGKVLIVAVSVGIILTIFGLDIAAVLTGAGIAGLAVSLGAKPAINELFAGLTVVITRPFKIGDMVVIGSNPALEVTKIGLLKTTFRTTYTNEYITMPNSTISVSKIVNRTPNTRKYRTSVYVTVEKDTNLMLVRKLLKEAALENQGVVKDSSVAKPTVIINNYRNNGGIEFCLLVYVNEYGDHSKICGQLREAIANKFKENGIGIPFAQEDYYIYIPKD